MEGLSGLQIVCARNVAAPEQNLCGAELGLAGQCCGNTGWMQDQVQKWFNCLSWHRASPNKHFEPKLALHRPISGIFGSTFAPPEGLYTCDVQRSKWLHREPEGLLIWAKFHLVELQTGPADIFRYLSPASCRRRDRSLPGWCHVNTGLGLVWY